MSDKSAVGNSGTGGCPMDVSHSNRAVSAASWWPDALNLSVLSGDSLSRDPMGRDFDYAREFAALDLQAVKDDLKALMRDSQSWWPADYGHYGPLFIRMAWHSAGTYRTSDGRGGGASGMQRFAPLNSWPDNANLDKARRLLWPIKAKYGRKLSWADLMILAGTTALEDMGVPSFGFSGGRVDVYAPDLTYWGPERTWLADDRHDGKGRLAEPLGAVQMGLIYVNPEGPGGVPDPQASAVDIRETFARMAMDDYETVALIAGGHTFGKMHGAADPGKYVGPEPEGAPIEQMGLGWQNSLGSGNAEFTISSGLEGAWTATPTSWDLSYLETLLEWEWTLSKSPAGAQQWIPVNPEAGSLVPDAHRPNVRHAPVMTTADLALKFDPAYEAIARHFLDNPAEFEVAFSQAWFKLTHRDLGPRSRYVGADAPTVDLVWQDPIPAPTCTALSDDDRAWLRSAILTSDLDGLEFIAAAWASAATFRITDKRGGANGARIRFTPQRDWAVNSPSHLARVLSELLRIQSEFETEHGVRVSIADLMVFAGGVCVEAAAARAGISIEVPFSIGRADALEELTDATSFDVLEPRFDGFRNYVAPGLEGVSEELLVERAALLGLSVVEMSVLVGGMRALGANTDRSKLGVLTLRPGTLSNDFFVNIVDMNVSWIPVDGTGCVFQGIDRRNGEQLWSASRVDLLFGSNSELRAVSEVYGAEDAQLKFVEDFVSAWVKVMDNDRFDLHR